MDSGRDGSGDGGVNNSGPGQCERVAVSQAVLSLI